MCHGACVACGAKRVRPLTHLALIKSSLRSRRAPAPITTADGGRQFCAVPDHESPRMPPHGAAPALVALALLLVAAAPSARAADDYALVLGIRNAWPALNALSVGSCPAECTTWPFLTWIPGPSPPQFVQGMYVPRVIASFDIPSKLSGLDARGVLGPGNGSAIPWPTGSRLSLGLILIVSRALVAASDPVLVCIFAIAIADSPDAGG